MLFHTKNDSLTRKGGAGILVVHPWIMLNLCTVNECLLPAEEDGRPQRAEAVVWPRGDAGNPAGRG